MKKYEQEGKETQTAESDTAVVEEQKSPQKNDVEQSRKNKPSGNNVAFASHDSDAAIYTFQGEKSDFSRRLSTYNYLNAHNFVALDIERDKVKYLTGKVSKKAVQVQEYGVEISKDMREEEHTNLPFLLEKIKSRFKTSGSKVFVSFFSPEIIIKQFILPKMVRTNDLRNAISYKLQAEISGFDEQLRWHYKIIEEFTEDNADFFRILVVLVPGDVVDRMMEMLYGAGFKPDVLLPRPIAAYNAYQRMMDEIETDILVDISYDVTHIYLITNNNLEYTRDIASGAINFETAVHDNSTVLKPEKLTVEDGIGESGALRADKIRDALNQRLKILQNQQDPALQLFKNELENSIQYFSKIQSDRPIKRIFLTGYGIQKEGLVSFLKRSMKLPVFVLAPKLNDWEKDILKFGQYFSTSGSVFAVKDSFDLVPQEYKRRKIYKRLNYLMALVIICTGLGLFYLNNAINKETADMKIQLSDFSIQYDALHPIELEYNDINRQINELQTEQSGLLGLIKKRGPVIEAMKFLSNETPAQIVLSNFTLSEVKDIVRKSARSRSGSKINNKKDVSQPDQKPQYAMQFTGNVTSDYLLSDITLINYIDHLKNLGVFKTVDLVNKDKKSSRQSMRFEIKVTL